jgi:hypothetical protein
MNKQVNPAWTQYNDINNEGGEGYNPHPKFLGDVKTPEVLDCMSAPMGFFPGRAISKAEATYLLSEEKRLLADAELRAKCGDLSASVAVDGIKSRVAHYAAQIA